MSLNIYLSLITLTISVHELVRCFYPEKYNEASFSVAYNGIYLYSKLQIVATKVYKYVMPHVDKLVSFSSVEWVEFIKDGIVIHKCSVNAAHPYAIENCVQCDFVLHHVDGYNIIHKSIPNKFTHEFIPCRNHFMMCDIFLPENNSSYELKLNNLHASFMVSKNTIDEHVIRYIFNKQYPTLSTSCSLDQYEISLIDSNILFLTLTQKDKICLDETSYYTIRHCELNLTPSLEVDENNADDVQTNEQVKVEEENQQEEEEEEKEEHVQEEKEVQEEKVQVESKETSKLSRRKRKRNVNTTFV